MTSTHRGLGPTSGQDRLLSVDVLRGIAVLGILVINILGFAYAGKADRYPNGDERGIDLLTFAVSYATFDGKMRAIFSMLFGAGVILLTERAAARGAGVHVADIYYRRTLWLIPFGLVHAFVFLFPGDILFFYGLCGLLLFPLRKLSARVLIVAGCLVLATFVPKSLWDAQNLRALQSAAAVTIAEGDAPQIESQQEMRMLWERRLERERPPSHEVQREIAIRRSGYVRNFKSAFRSSQYIHSRVFYRAMFWDVLGAMLVGMGLMKMGFFTAGWSRRDYIRTALIGYGIGLPVTLYMMFDTARHDFDVVHLSYIITGHHIVRLPIAIAHVAVVMLWVKSGQLARLQSGLASVGCMALSNYVLETLLCGLAFYGYGLGFFAALSRSQVVLVILAIWGTLLVFSSLWLTRFRFGPLEWLWRSLTYLRPQPIRRTSRTTASRDETPREHPA